MIYGKQASVRNLYAGTARYQYLACNLFFWFRDII